MSGDTSGALNSALEGSQDIADRITTVGVGAGSDDASASATEVATGSADCELLGGTLNLWSDGNYYCTAETV